MLHTNFKHVVHYFKNEMLFWSWTMEFKVWIAFTALLKCCLLYLWFNSRLILRVVTDRWLLFYPWCFHFFCMCHWIYGDNPQCSCLLLTILGNRKKGGRHGCTQNHGVQISGLLSSLLFYSILGQFKHSSNCC